MFARRKTVRTPVVALLTLLCLLAWSAPTAQARSEDEAQSAAREILKTSGMKGGLVVHAGCGNGRLTAALRANDRYLVQGLAAKADDVQQAREYVTSRGLYGPVSVDQWDAKKLPYGTNTVNLLVVDNGRHIPREEIMRVLAPRGVACMRDGDGWKKTVKPWPSEIDEWPHYLHGPDNNAVAQDSVVGPPRHFQWIGKPRFSRSHDHLATVTAMVSSGGKIFYIVDKGSTAFVAASPKWTLVARDAFSGVVLWERDVSPWAYHLRDFRSGPANLARRLVAVDDRVYVTLGYGKPVTALDAATGETVHTYAGTESTTEILRYEDMLLLVQGDRKKNWRAEKAKEIVSQKDYTPPFEHYVPPVHNTRVMALDAKTGKKLWKNSEPYARTIMPSTLAADEGRVFFQNTDEVVCVDARSGKMQWKSSRPAQMQRLAWSTPTLVARDGILFSADRRAEKTEGELLWLPSGGYHQYIRGNSIKGKLIAFDAETGERIWSCPAYEGFNAPVDILIADGLLWTGQYAWGNDPGITRARALQTGEVKRNRPPDSEFLPGIGHARCHRAKATEDYLILGRRGIEFVDVKTGDMLANRWVRGICQYGVMPCNGLIYVPPHSCACSQGDLIKSGFIALAPERKNDGMALTGPALHKGPAYGSALGKKSSEKDAWPTYRHDGYRSGTIDADIPADLKNAWKTDLGGQLTSPVEADGRLLVAQKDAHRVHALDAETGKVQWSFVAGARIDSPPTLYRGRALFGSADGWVYCVRLADGALVWKYRAAPGYRRIVADCQIESTWPVTGNVLVVDGAAYFAVGRTSYLDGGMYLCKLDAETGEKLKVRKLKVDEEKRNSGFASGGHLPDILSTDGDSIFMRSARFDLDLNSQNENVPHLWSSAGFRDDNWWHRTYWQVGSFMKSGWGGWPKAGRKVPAGRLLVTDGSRLFGFGRNQYDIPGAHVGVDGAQVWGPVGKGQSRWTFYRLFGSTTDTRPDKARHRKPAEKDGGGPNWTCRIPVIGRAMVLANKTLFVAGPDDPVTEVPHEPEGVDPLAEALESTKGGRLLAVSATDGKTTADYELESPPVFDGMCAAKGRLYISTRTGQVVCLGPSH